MTDPRGIESILKEQRKFPPDESFTAAARLKPDDLDALYRAAEQNHEGYWAGLAREAIQWTKPLIPA